MGAKDFLNKPVDSTEFIARLKNMLILRKHQRELANRAEWLQKEVKKATEEILLREIANPASAIDKAKNHTLIFALRCIFKRSYLSSMNTGQRGVVSYCNPTTWK